MKKFIPYFAEEIYPLLLKPNGNNPVRNRADSLLKVFSMLDEKQLNEYHILETGCMRADHGQLCFGDDGAFTYIADKFINRMGGTFSSVDISGENVAYSKSVVSDKTNMVCGDSVAFLYSIPIEQKFDLIYLDSMDILRDKPILSQMHHLTEMCALMKNIKEGTIIVVDDHNAFFTKEIGGKGDLVKMLLVDVCKNAKILHEDYQIVFEITHI